MLEFLTHIIYVSIVISTSELDLLGFGSKVPTFNSQKLMPPQMAHIQYGNITNIYLPGGDCRVFI